MTEHPSDEQLRKFENHELNPSDLITVGDHLEECQTCSSKLNETILLPSVVRAFDREMRSSGFVRHPSYGQMVDSIDGALDPGEEEALQSHLKVCEPCNSEWTDLNDLREEIDAEPASQGPPLTVAPIRSAPSRILWKAAGIAAVLAVLGLLLTVTFQRRVSDLQGKLTSTQQKVTDLENENNKLRAVSTSSSVPPQIAIQDGDWSITVDQQGNIRSVKSLSPQHQETLRAALMQEHLQPPQWIADLIGERTNILRNSNYKVTFPLIGPVATAVEAERPTFRWSALKDAASYVVRLYDTDYSSVAESPALTATSWTPSVPLARGKSYTWTVTATTPAGDIKSPVPPAPEARFQILSRTSKEEIDGTRAKYGDSRLIMALLYVQTGLLDDAEMQFQELARQNPDSPSVKNLLHQLESLRGTH